MAVKQPEPTDPPPAPAPPCPRCGHPLAEASDKLLRAMGLEGVEHVTVRRCHTCGIAGAMVEGLQTTWRPAGPRQFDDVRGDADEGLRHRHMLLSDDLDRIWGPL